MSQFNLPATPTSSPFGWPRTKREEEFAKLKKVSGLPTFRVVFQRKPQDFPIICVPINLPKYRMANGRTISVQEEELAKDPKLRRDLFGGDPELLDAQEAQHKLLLKLAKQADLLNYFKDASNQQVEPILLDEMGFVVNGNRRLATWRMLYAEDSQKYQHFAYIDVVALPHCDEKEIDRLEASLQIQKDIQADYSWDAQANMMLQKRKRDNFTDKELAELYKMKESDVRQLIDMRDYAAEYLRYKNKENRWSLVSGARYAFQRMVTCRSKIISPAEQELFKHAAFTLIGEAEEVEDRLYAAIPHVQEYLDQIKAKLLSEFPVEPPQANDELDDLFGVVEQVDAAIDIPLAALIRKPENVETTRRIIIDVIDSQNQLKKDVKTANHLLDCLGKANADLAAAIREGLRPETNKSGVDSQLREIKKQIEHIEKWFTEHA